MPFLDRFYTPPVKDPVWGCLCRSPGRLEASRRDNYEFIVRYRPQEHFGRHGCGPKNNTAWQADLRGVGSSNPPAARPSRYYAVYMGLVCLKCPELLHFSTLGIKSLDLAYFGPKSANHAIMT